MLGRRHTVERTPICVVYEYRTIWRRVADRRRLSTKLAWICFIVTRGRTDEQGSILHWTTDYWGNIGRHCGYAVPSCACLLVAFSWLSSLCACDKRERQGDELARLPRLCYSLGLVCFFLPSSVFCQLLQRNAVRGRSTSPSVTW